MGFYGWSYPYYYDYYPYPYYGASAYYSPAYYETPVYSPTPTNYPSTNVPNGTGVAPGNYQMQAGNTRAATQSGFPDVFVPRMELPSREAPEALPDEEAVESSREASPLETPQPNGSRK